MKTLLAILLTALTCHAAAPMPPSTVPRLTLAQAKAKQAAKAKATNPPQKRGNAPTVAMAKALAVPTHNADTCINHMHIELIKVNGVPKVYVWMRHDTDKFWATRSNTRVADPFTWFTPPTFESRGNMTWVVLPVDGQQMFFQNKYWPTVPNSP